MPQEEEFCLGEGAYETLDNVIAAVIDDFVEPEHRPPRSRLMDNMDDFLGYLPSLYRSGLVWLLRGLEVAPLAMGYRRQFSNLEREDQVKVLDAFEKSGNLVQRSMILALKSMSVFMYFNEPEIEKALGYTHQCLLDVKPGSPGE